MGGIALESRISYLGSLLKRNISPARHIRRKNSLTDITLQDMHSAHRDTLVLDHMVGEEYQELVS
jgi:hypothetical protein